MDKQLIKRIGIIILLFLIFFSFSVHADSAKENVVVCNLDEHNMFSKVVSQMLPLYDITKDQSGVFNYLSGGAVIEAFEIQAQAAIEQNIAEYWYPMYLATVVIAIDRDKTDVFMSGWGDLSDMHEDVSFFSANFDREMVLLAMSYGLEGEKFSLERATNILSNLYDRGHLVFGSSDSAIMICYDYQAATLIESGRNIEIVIPIEGTYTYVKGLLSKNELTFLGDVDEILLDAGFILLDENRKEGLYPAKETYLSADRVVDFKHLSVVNQDAGRIIRREVLGVRKYTSADVREHQIITLLYIILIAAWISLVIWRVMQKNIRRAAVFAGGILICWIIARLIKWQMTISTTFTRHLWYSFYLFQFAITLVLLWIALAIDKPDDTISVPKWFNILAIIDMILIVLVFTNDIHNLVFNFDLNNAAWSSEYTYGPVFYLICIAMIIPVIAAIVILLLKSKSNPRKRAFPFPLIFCGLLFAYGYGYITRVPFAWESDFTMIIGVFTLLFIETAIQSGLIPSNTKYISLFANSPLYLEIVDASGKIAISSKKATKLDEKSISTVINEDMPLAQRPIDGGFAIWQEDLSTINNFQRELGKLSENLRNANAMLINERESKKSSEQAKAKMQLMEQLEEEILEHIETLSEKIETLPNADNIKKETVQIALLICYIKRRCNLFFRQQENGYLLVDELARYIDELSEIAGHSLLKVISSYKLEGQVSILTSTLMYDFFYEFVSIGIDTSVSFILCNIERENDVVNMSILPSENIDDFQLQYKVVSLIAKTSASIDTKEFDDVTGFTLSFCEGGCD